jgi:hypothetical protein
MRWMQKLLRRSGRKVRNWWESLSSSGHRKPSLQTTNRSRNIGMENGMIKRIDLAGSFTLSGTSMTVNHMGYGAMQLSGRDGNKRVWGPPPRY